MRADVLPVAFTCLHVVLHTTRHPSNPSLRCEFSPSLSVLEYAGANFSPVCTRSQSENNLACTLLLKNTLSQIVTFCRNLLSQESLLKVSLTHNLALTCNYSPPLNNVAIFSPAQSYDLSSLAQPAINFPETLSY